MGAGAGDAGGLGYLLKDRVARVADFMRSLGIVAAGGVVVDPEVASRLIQGKGSALDALTPREREVLQGIFEGKLTKVIADELGIGVRTAETYRQLIMQKLQAGSVAELVRIVVEAMPRQTKVV